MNTLLAACIFFTRLPLGRLGKVPPGAFRHILARWSLTGWLTGGVTAGVLWLCARALPLPAALVVALGARVCLTGALHEDAWADFLDGFGGGRTREQTLAIMKDSALGTYGLLGLVFYFLLLWSLLSAFPTATACALVIGADAWCKSIAACLPNLLPYARGEAESKAGVVYEPMSRCGIVFSHLAGLLPLLVFLPPGLWVSALFPLPVFFFMFRAMKKRLQGYTGDCCGAVFVACESAFYLFAAVFYAITC
ncbi:MAG: adenosylcobinamide-GDP ribazoletransferase [Tannerellaceae bacterium]|jgi:adenosylcobinamide-GDP ribazoletransferase|nr:adenosylcobinamide-GDP ribazoletransferase [Tannerellaceae bacterium]